MLRSTHSSTRFCVVRFVSWRLNSTQKRTRQSQRNVDSPSSKATRGLGLTLSEFAVISEELGRSPLGHYVFNCQAPDIGNTEILITHGTDEQKRTYLEPLIKGDVRSCFSMTEPEHAGSNPSWMSTSAVRDGSDYVINGHKWFTSSAEGASFLRSLWPSPIPTRPTNTNEQVRSSFLFRLRVFIWYAILM